MASTTMADMLYNVESKIGYHFIDPSILWEALQAAGSNVRQIGARRLPDGKKRLALLGDAVLKLALLAEWYDGEEPKGPSIPPPPAFMGLRY